MPGEANHRAGNNGYFRFVPANDAGGSAEGSLEAILAAQRRDWMSGKRIPAHERLRQYPALAADSIQGAELVYHEFALRQELGEAPDWQDYLRRFPQYATALRLLGQADQMVEQALPAVEEGKRSLPQLDGYEMLEEIGRGGMGVIYKAQQISLDRVVAVKMLRAGEDADEDKRKRFRREAEAVARLQHPNIVQIHEVGEAQAQPFLALEFVEGLSFAQHLNGTPLPARQAASLLEVLARAMHYAHEKGIIHRDLKPSNVLLAGMPETGWEGCVPKITDFGLAKRLDKAGDTESGQVLGTPGYMAPEQAEPGTAAIDRRSDVYSLGVMLYELLTGRRPFLADSPLQTVKQILEAEPARPRLLNPAVPGDLETICLKCLEKEPGRRYATAQGLADDLRRFLSGEPIRARPVGAIERGWRWCRRKPVIAGLAAALLIAIAGGFSISVVLWRQAVSSLTHEQEARQEAEDNFTMIREILDDIVQLSPQPSSLRAPDPNPFSVELLHKAEARYSRLLEKRAHDVQLQAMLSIVLIRLGKYYFDAGQKSNSLAFFEKATQILEPLPSQAAPEPERLANAVNAYLWLGQANELNGRLDAAQKAFEAALRLWQEMAKGSARLDLERDALVSGLQISQFLINDGHSEGDIRRRFGSLRGDADLLGGAQQYDLFLDLLQASFLCSRVERPGQQADVLAAAREAAGILDRCYQSAFLHRSTRLWVASYSIRLSPVLRKGRAVNEAFHLTERATRTLQELVCETPNAAYLLEELERFTRASHTRNDHGTSQEYRFG